MNNVIFFLSIRRRHTRCALVTGVQTCPLPILPELNNLMRTLKTWRTLELGDKAVAIGRHSSRLRAAGATGSASDLELLDDDPVRERVMDELVEQHPLANAMVRNRKAELDRKSTRLNSSH